MNWELMFSTKINSTRVYQGEKRSSLSRYQTEGEWNETGGINKSHLLTFFDIDGNYDFKKLVFELEKIDPHSSTVSELCLRVKFRK